jgi:hypothetical protein
MIRNLIALFIFATIACGTPAIDDIGKSMQAFVSNPVFNPEDGFNEPFLCSGLFGPYDPFSVGQGYPVHGWCAWQPRAGFTTVGLSDCVGIPPVGTVDIWSGTNFTGACARVNGASVWDWPHVAVNGWNAVRMFKTDPVWTSIKSFELGTSSTSAMLFLFYMDLTSDDPRHANPTGGPYDVGNSFFCAGHTGSAAEHRQFCGISHLGIYSASGWTDTKRISAFEVIPE